MFVEQTVSKVVNRDESWVKKSSSSGSQTLPSVRQTPPPVGNKSIKDRNMQLWENSAKESQKKMDKTKVDIPANRSINKIKNITKAFEEKESSAKAEPVIQRRSDYGRKSWSMDSTDSPFRRRSSDFSDKSDKSSPKGFNEKNVSPLLSPTSPKALLPKDQRPSPSNNFKYTSDYSSNKVCIYNFLSILFEKKFLRYMYVRFCCFMFHKVSVFGPEAVYAHRFRLMQLVELIFTILRQWVLRTHWIQYFKLMSPKYCV